MTTYLDLLALLKEMSGQASFVEENWGHLKLSGGAFPDLLVRYNELKGKFVPLGFHNLLSLTLNGTAVAAEDLELYEHSVVSSWTLDLNKLPMISKKDVDGWHYNLFLKKQHFQDWLSGGNLLTKKHPFNVLKSIRVLIDDLTGAFGGEMLQFLSPSQLVLPALTVREQAVRSGLKLPGSQALREYTHFITMEEIEVNPAVFLVFGPGPVKMKEILMYKACQVLSLYLLNEYYENDKVVIDGIKRVVLKLDDGSAKVTEQFYFELLSLVSWVYEDRVSVRRKLFNERLSLDRDEQDCLLVALTKNITGASAQAKERYNFVITDRQDAYVKELKELLKDIRTQSELYSVKIRTLLSNFLRDLLAAIVLVGFTLFTKFTDNEKLVNQDLLKYVFYGLAVYYLLSILMQSIVDIVDISVSKKEILYWKNATKEQLPEKEFKDHIDKSLKGRRTSLRIIYPIVALCYLGIALACLKYTWVFKDLMKREAAKKAVVVGVPIPVLVPAVGSIPGIDSLSVADSLRMPVPVRR
ncbi:hypothetical protein [Pedobacter sp. JCM 36344]|uniref:hypothetical protein n=1 Tax=Pedobacter sp. JCM 36344 TaxID=3374280 RepID=UPI003979C26D